MTTAKNAGGGGGGGRVFYGEIFLGGEGMSKFLAGGGDFPPISPSEKNPVYIYIYIYVCMYICVYVYILYIYNIYYTKYIYSLRS